MYVYARVHAHTNTERHAHTHTTVTHTQRRNCCFPLTLTTLNKFTSHILAFIITVFIFGSFEQTKNWPAHSHMLLVKKFSIDVQNLSSNLENT